MKPSRAVYFLRQLDVDLHIYIGERQKTIVWISITRFSNRMLKCYLNENLWYLLQFDQIQKVVAVDARQYCPSFEMRSG